jgi:hypothetical protein
MDDNNDLGGRVGGGGYSFSYRNMSVKYFTNVSELMKHKQHFIQKFAGLKQQHARYLNYRHAPIYAVVPFRKVRCKSNFGQIEIEYAFCQVKKRDFMRN